MFLVGRLTYFDEPGFFAVGIKRAKGLNCEDKEYGYLLVDIINGFKVFILQV